jgi:hypothetical protein
MFRPSPNGNNTKFYNCAELLYIDQPNNIDINCPKGSTATKRIACRIKLNMLYPIVSIIEVMNDFRPLRQKILLSYVNSRPDFLKWNPIF